MQVIIKSSKIDSIPYEITNKHNLQKKYAIILQTQDCEYCAIGFNTKEELKNWFIFDYCLCNDSNWNFYSLLYNQNLVDEIKVNISFDF